jgi:hypothetical protein
MYPNDAPGSGGTWSLTEVQVAEVLAYFAGGGVSNAQASARARPVTRSNGPAFDANGVPTEWHWEGHVQRALVEFLLLEGWAIDHVADTASREQGPDVSASRKGIRLLIEVKGYPSVGYRDPRRAAEVKRTNPTLQAKHWFSEALLKSIRLQHSTPTAAIAVCFPRADRYDSLFKETQGAFAALGVGYLVIDQAGNVEVLVEPRGSRIGRGAAS